ncbi:MAG TPA: lipid-A-disaccharide synthase [Terriglobia bacterium]|nr:lipid-A-disaccharide synthase [Terriglobia bacterium]
MPPLTLMIVAGERSGDVYGGRLAQTLKTRYPELPLFGCGGDMMRQAGVETAADLQQFAMVGITEVVSGLPRAYQAFHRLVREAARRRPRLAILIDSPSLNMRLAKRLKRLGIPVLYFISPQIWAWKKWRLRQLASLVDRMVCIFDFEPEIYHRAGIPAEYAGHPLVDAVAPRLSREEFITQAGLDPAIPTVALLPGSREIEIAYVLPTLLDAVEQLSSRRRLQFVLAAAPTLNVHALEGRLRRNPEAMRHVHLVSHSTYEALAYSELAIVASGTATVEAALLERPMVVVYRVSLVTAFFARRMVDTPFFSMVNILAGKRVVQELIQKDFTASRVTAEALRLLEDAPLRSEMLAELRAVRLRLGESGAIERVADTAVRMVRESGAALPAPAASAITR